ncbi:MAG: hypothetical protein QOF02_1491 [Blastocatellia bacterium]|jgi:hypothetical protein|nr:hypothetical protein [Blastocatellia bacterium]
MSVNGWSGQQSLGGAAKDIIAASNKDGRLEIFYIGMDNNIYHNWQDPKSANGWGGQQPLTGQAKKLVAASNTDGRLELIYIGMDNNIYHNWQV